MEVELLNEMKKFLNFQYEIVNCNQIWGSYINGTWNGIIGKVLDEVNK